MVQGLYIAASGIRANQAAIDVTANNVANVNTISFKSSRANFENTFVRTLKGGNRPANVLGGINPTQLGTGSAISEIATNQNQGGTQFTGRSTDLRINGNGYFVVQNLDSTGVSTGPKYFTRAGNFSLDAEGALVTSTGDHVNGTSQLVGAAPVTTDTIRVPLTLNIAKFTNATGTVLGTAMGKTTSTVADFNAYATANGLTGSTTNMVSTELSNISIGAGGAITATYASGDRLTVRPNPNSATGKTELMLLTSEGGLFSAINPAGANGTFGQLSGTNAAITATNSGANPLEGMTLQLQTVTFPNVNGLESVAKNGFIESANSGTANYGVPGSGSRAGIQAGSLESSNVDMAYEFSNLVVAQRGLEANSRIIRTESEVLQSIINAVN
jgi:flagellar hook protein FlgE